MPNKGRSLSTEENELGEKIISRVISRVYREPDKKIKKLKAFYANYLQLEVKKAPYNLQKVSKA